MTNPFSSFLYSVPRRERVLVVNVNTYTAHTKYDILLQSFKASKTFSQKLLQKHVADILIFHHKMAEQCKIPLAGIPFS